MERPWLSVSPGSASAKAGRIAHPGAARLARLEGGERPAARHGKKISGFGQRGLSLSERRFGRERSGAANPVIMSDFPDEAI